MTMSTAPAARSRTTLCRFAAGAEAGEQFDAEGIIGHALAEGVEMLLGQDGGGGEDGDLFAAQGGFEGGADGHFGFAVADVAADEPVHRAGALPCRALVASDGAHLVGGFLDRRSALEFALPARRRAGRHGRAGMRGRPGWRAFRRRHRARRRSAWALVLAQRAPPRVLRRRARLAGADVFADQMRLADRHVKFGRRLASDRRGAYSMTRHSWPASAMAAAPAAAWPRRRWAWTCRPK